MDPSFWSAQGFAIEGRNTKSERRIPLSRKDKADMKLIKKASLHFQEGNSNKVYEVELSEAASRKDDRFLVNFRYGRQGGALREGTKTPAPVTLEEAERLFDSVVVSKTNKGYYDISRGALATSAGDAGSKPATPEGPTDMLVKLLEKLRQEWDNGKRARLIWRLGELGRPEAGQELAACVGKGDWLQDFAVAWALGRTRATNYMEDLHRLQNSKNSTVSAMAFESILALTEPSQRMTLLQTQWNQTPSPLQQALTSGDDVGVRLQLENGLNAAPAGANDLLKNAYLLALHYPSLYEALYGWLSQCKLAPGVFSGVRYIYKAAEFRLDARMFALLARRFETSREFFQYQWDWAWLPGVGSFKPKSELKKPDPKVAYSNKTRNYLRRRSWRSIKRIGQVGDLRYVDMATEMLLTVSDADAGQTRKADIYRWERNGRRYEHKLVARNVYDHYAGLIAFNHILRGDSAQYKLAPSGRAWLKVSDERAEGAREEAFAHLWDQRPDCALRLLLESQCAPVHEFACKALAANASFCAEIAVSDIERMLRSRYEATQRFALQLARTRLDGHIEHGLLLALLNSGLEEARALGMEILARLPQTTLVEAPLLAALLLAQYEEVRRFAADKTAQYPWTASDQAQCLHALIEQALQTPSELPPALTQESHAVWLADFCIARFADACRELSLHLIDRLLAERNTALQLFGARLLVAHGVDFGDIPERLLQHIMQSESSAVRACQTLLLGKQPDAELIKQAGVLALQFFEGEADDRNAAAAILKRLALAQRDWAEAILHHLLPFTFRSEKQDGQREEWLTFFKDALSAAFDAVDDNTCWRLLQAQSTGAQQIGALLLQQRSPLQFSVRQWAQLAKHADVAVRQYAFNAYEANPDRILAEIRDGLRILDSNWDDCREFGFAFFRSHYEEAGETLWTPELVVYLCDSVRPDVQRYGMELLQRFFQEQNGVEYLLKLSQHPSANVQFFVSNFLNEYAAGHSERIFSLQGYFTTVLSQVNRSRICKDRILAFLSEQSLLNEQVANMAADLFTRISLTVVHKDKAALIKALLDLRRHYPQLGTPLSVKPAEVREY
ncbi:probable DNA binding protein containing WGR domain [Hahella chejuensis KCTC 2396]|uniref:Probable DNA binding protein containing WGR domain n=2 Tax=Hahella chejuensis TaxID=158327 RepID=Q2SF94_HAHCH|nr:probable DNA binding protein containing WGR domain [Hahella chejuensis KCTC 2396]